MEHLAHLIVASIVVTIAFLVVIGAIAFIAGAIGGENFGIIVFLVLLIGVPSLSWIRFQNFRKADSDCKQHVLFTPSVWAGNEDTGFRLCDHTWSFWNWNNN